jgi:hypothetical protein
MNAAIKYWGMLTDKSVAGQMGAVENPDKKGL